MKKLVVICLVLGAVISAPTRRGSDAQALLGRNLVPNSSFEETADGRPSGWRWDPGRAGATLTLDGTASHSGKRSIKIANPTAMSPHVYSHLSTTILLTASTAYTLSCYVRSDDPGIAWIGGGNRWRVRFHFPRTGGAWQRVVGTFTAEPGEEQFPLMILTESPTKGLWVDDVQLERGQQATPYIFPHWLSPGETKLNVLQNENLTIGKNLIPNSSFEVVDGNRPKFWMWDRRNTDATMTIDAGVAHSGKNSIKFTNGTGYSPQVYGWFGLTGGVPVKPRTTYTVSCFVKSESPGIAWIGGGKDWRIRAMSPRTSDHWVRVQQTFTTLEDETSFPFMIVTESPGSFWVDDVKLEEGDEATFYLSDFEPAPTRLDLNAPQTGLRSDGATMTASVWMPDRYPAFENVFASDQLATTGIFYTPQPLTGATLSVRIEDKAGRVLAESQTRQDLTAGVAAMEFDWGLGNMPPTDCRLIATVHDSHGQTAAAQSVVFKLFTRSGIEETLQEVEQRNSELHTSIQSLQRKGIDPAYLQVTATVLDNFLGYAREDIEHGELRRAWYAAQEMEDMAKQALLKRREVETRKSTFPRYVTSPIKISGPSFLAQTSRYRDSLQSSPVTRPVFFTGYGAFNQVRSDVEKFPGYGVNIIQIEFGPSSIFPAEGQTSDGAAKELLSVMDRAAKANVAVNWLMSPHYFPGWMMEKYPHLKGCDGGFLQFCIDAPESRDLLERYLRYVIPKIKNHPALHSICLSNEPICVDTRKCEFTKKEWRDWLERKHGTVAKLNECYGANYGSFTSVPIPEPRVPQVSSSSPTERGTFALFYDWCCFNNERFAGWHKWLADIIHSMAPNLPVHAKIMTTFFDRNTAHWGVDPELFGQFSQINGNDCCKWHSHQPRGGWASDWLTENMGYDLQRSVADKPIFNSENHVIIDRDLDYIPAVHIRNCLWQGAIHGQSATALWVWERTYDPRSDIAGNIMHRPACAEAVGHTNLDLNRLALEVTALQRLKPQIVLLYSAASIVHRVNYLPLLGKAYEALSFCGVKLGFVTERQLAAGKWGASPQAAKVVVVPEETSRVSDATVAALREFSERGGQVLLLGNDCMRWDEYGRERKGAGQWRGATCLTDTKQFPDSHKLWELLQSRLERWGLWLPVRVTDGEGNPVWGVEYLTTKMPDGRTVVDLVNYRSDAQRVRLMVKGKLVHGVNLMDSGGTDVLEPLVPYLVQAP